MSTQDNVKIVQDIYAAFGQGNIPAILNALADDVEWHEPPGGEPPINGTYRGHDGVGKFFQGLAGVIDVLGFEAQEFVAQGDTVVGLGHSRFRAKATGITFDTDWAMVWWFRGSKVVKFQVHRDSATEAAALRGA